MRNLQILSFPPSRTNLHDPSPCLFHIVTYFPLSTVLSALFSRLYSQ